MHSENMNRYIYITGEKFLSVLSISMLGLAIFSSFNLFQSNKSMKFLQSELSDVERVLKKVETYQTYYEKHINYRQTVSNVRVRLKESIDKRLLKIPLTNANYAIDDPLQVELTYRNTTRHKSEIAPEQDLLVVNQFPVRVSANFRSDAELFAFSLAMYEFPHELVSHSGCHIKRGQLHEKHQLDCLYIVFDIKAQSSKT